MDWAGTGAARASKSAVRSEIRMGTREPRRCEFNLKFIKISEKHAKNSAAVLANRICRNDASRMVACMLSACMLSALPNHEEPGTNGPSL